MRHKKFYLIKASLAACLLFTSTCSGANTAALSPKIVLVGSTPGDSIIKSMLSISPDKQVDFIRWDLTLDQTAYVLNIVFGEGQPNTRGFKGGGETISIRGKYTVSKKPRGEIYELRIEKTPTPISLVRLNENLFHLLTPDNKPMVGNGGWSYTLNRKDRVTNNSAVLTSWTTSLLVDTAKEAIFDGRTPCVNLGRKYDLHVGDDCRKIKWKITLHREPETNRPTTYILESTLNRPKPIEGKWTITKGTKANPGAIILQLDADKPGDTISFLVGDENVLFFLDKNLQLLAGDEDFGFTLDRRRR